MADTTVQSFLDAYEQSDIADTHIPVPRIHRCCCGNDACAYLQYNQSALDGLERDVRTAAKLGQALLMRHEAYIADSERERKHMSAQLETLEMEKQVLERKNATVIEENRYLLDQLEAVNSAVADSDTHVTNLQATLQSTQQELHRLSQLAARTEKLEQQLAQFEREQVIWQTSLDHTEEAEKSAVRRWQQAERTLADLQEQIERIEREAREERERHVEVLGRMERRQAVERELTSAAGRLKGAAAVKTAGRDAGGGTNVVSHFVKDILSDNANLQMGIVELREMLQNSNDEVELLRKKWEDHQPGEQPNGGEAASETTVSRKDLRAELSRSSSQELHVHHHYHAPPSASGSKVSTIRRPKKKRYGALTPGHFTPPSGYSTPRSSISYGTPSSAATILQQTAVSVPQQIPKRFSVQTNHTQLSMLSSSGPSSPQSTTNRTSSLFDHVFSDAGHDSSRPTTPDTEDPGSPYIAPVYSKRVPNGGFRTHSMPIMHRRGISSSTGRLSLDSVLSTSADNAPITPLHSSDHAAIPEEAEWENDDAPIVEEDSSVTSPYSDDAMDMAQEPSPFYRQPLRRAASHESLLSISGMDIHTSQSRPAQLSNPYSARSFTSQAVLSEAHAHAATPATISRASATSRGLLSGMAADQRQAGRLLNSKPSIGQKVGGWVFGRWGSTPALSTGGNIKTTATDPGKPPSSSSANDVPVMDPEATPKKAKYRPPGINQAGPIIGFPPEVKQQHLPVMKSLDEEALKKALDN